MDGGVAMYADALVEVLLQVHSSVAEAAEGVYSEDDAMMHEHKL
jgi:hypothetical protein